MRENPPKPFNVFESVRDDQTRFAPKPKGARSALSLMRVPPAYFVPVAFVAKDWNVTPRRIRFLLSVGRLEGRLLENGYWEVVYPYSFTFGTRGPSLKRQQKPPKRAKPSTEKPELRSV
jgi:hypothetical protein